jgi:hypothetical protein
MIDFEQIPWEDNQAPRKMPVGFRLYFWLLIIEVTFLTAYVWFQAIGAWLSVNSGQEFPVGDFARIFLAYHIILLLWSLVAYMMQAVWRLMGTFALFPVCLTICVLSLNVTEGLLLAVLRQVI